MFATGADLTGDARVMLTRSGPAAPQLAEQAAASTSYLLNEAERRLGFEVASELRLGGWAAAGSRQRLELDVALDFWSGTSWYRPQEIGNCGASCRRNLPREWRDTFSIRLSTEREITEHVQLCAGVAREPSPLPIDRRDTASARDAWVYAAGATLNLRRISVDLGYAFRRGASTFRHVVGLSVHSW